MENRNDGRNNGANELALFANIMKLVITVIFVLPLIHYSIYNEVKTLDEPTEIKNDTPLLNDTQDNVTVVERVVVKQPSCPTSYMQVIFSEICDELFVKKEMCTPEDVHNLDKHKMPKIIARNKSGQEPRGTLVGYLAAGLLLSSLGAAIVELYKAKSQAPAKSKPPLNRKCSLADLTVLKHNRKELARRDSILELPEDGSTKQSGFRPPPLHRRCSFPVGPNQFSYGLDVSLHGSRKGSLIESRRPSIIMDSRRTSVEYSTINRSPLAPSSSGNRRISVGNDSPERTRHTWTRLLHRH